MQTLHWIGTIIYFAVLIFLGCYGLHRYWMIFLYLRHRKEVVEPSEQLPELPLVTVQLPLYNEMYVAERLLDAVVALDYPKDKLEVQVLDDSTDETTQIVARKVARLAEQGFQVRHIHRTNRDGFKAGALENGLHQATGEYIAIFDADFVPPRDLLQKIIHFFVDPGVGMIQTRWGHLNERYSLLTRIQSMLLDGHFLIEQTARARSGRFFNFNGTAGIWRRSCIEEAGGWHHDTLAEDLDLSYRAQIKGWRFMYLPGLDCPSELPVEMHGFQVQQSRWAKGLTQVARKLLPSILRADVSKRIKAEAFLHLTPNISYPLMIVISALMLPVMIVRFYMGVWEMVLIDLPLIGASFWSISLFYVVAQRELYPKHWKRSILMLPMLMAVGVGLTIINTRAVLEALFGVETAFARTPKYAIADRPVNLEVKKYRRRSGWLPYAELLAGTYFASMVVFAIETYNFFSIPFLLLFVFGYYWAGFATLYQEYQGRLQWLKQQRLALSSRA